MNTLENTKNDLIKKILVLQNEKLIIKINNFIDEIKNDKNLKTKKQRAIIAEASGISEVQILKFAKMADLFRITGVGHEFSELLEAAGVDTVTKLANRNPENLTVKMEKINAEKNLTRRTPSLKEVEKWVAEAKYLPRAIEKNELNAIETKKQEILKKQKTKLSEKYKGIFSIEDTESFNNHTLKMRNEW